MSRINFGGTENQGFKVNIRNFSITIDLGTKRGYLVGVCIHENIIMSMDYDGRNKQRVKAGDRINAMAVFGGILYWQKHNTNVVDVINAMTMEVNRTISLPKQWSILNDLRVIDTLHQRRIGKLRKNTGRFFNISIIFGGELHAYCRFMPCRSQRVAKHVNFR